MSHDLYSAEEVADRLGLHVRTVRNYVRDGKLKAVRIGKQYRIAREDLATLTGRSASAPAVQTVSGDRHVEVSSFVQIDAIGREAANRVTNGIMSAVKGRDAREEPLCVDTIYDEERERLKVIVTGSISTTASLLKLIAVYADS